MEDKRPNPDELLASLQQDEGAKKRGKLRIFFGMSPGVGKTYAMLKASQADAAKGVQVVVGYVESHNRPETNALLEGLEVLPRKKIEYKGRVLEEMDLDAILAMHPYLVVVDELAHTNAPGSRHVKRYQDVQEILDNGINVYTTVNVQHLESRADTVAQITGITVRETLPDEIFEQADEVELVDITPDELLIRLAEGKVYTPERSQEAVRNFFRKGNITALREMSLRVVADRVDRQLKNYMQRNRIQGPWRSGLHFMVLVTSAAASAQLIRWTKTMSAAMGADWVALHIEPAQPPGEEEMKLLTDNINLVRQLGGELITTYGADVVRACIETARRENITHVVVGKTGVPKSFTARLIRESGNIDVYVLGSDSPAGFRHKNVFRLPGFTSRFNQYVSAAMAVAVTVLLCLPLASESGYQSVSFVMLFVLSILATFLRIGPVLLAATLGALAWNFFFIPPIFTLNISKPADLLAFLMFFFIALLNGILTARIRKQERLALNREKQTGALFHLTKGLAGATGLREVVAAGVENIRKYFDVDAFFILQDSRGQLPNAKYLPKEQTFSQSELGIANWVLKHGKSAGRYTDTLPSGEYTYYPLKGSRVNPGVVALKHKKAFAGATAVFWDTFLTQISQAVEHQYLGQMARRANLLDESDKLYKTLFNSISHELRIPVATIMGASDTLLAKSYPDEVKAELYGEIFKASKRLHRLIENLLSMSRLESGRIAVRLDWCDVHDLFNRVTENLAEELKPYTLDVVIPDPMPLVRLDFGLMEQVLHNLTYNSCLYATPGTVIRLKAFYDNGMLVLQEMDRGLGFAPETLPYVFNKFYRSDKGGNAGGLGLGLSIAKGFVEAHKGTISVENRQNGGARFTIQIPTEISYGNENE